MPDRSNYKKELAAKQQRVESLLEGLVSSVEPIIGSDNPYHYRNKVHAAVGVSKGRVIAGTYEPGTHRIIEGGGSELENEAASAVIADIVAIANKYHMSVYNEKTGQGLLRRILIRTADGTGQMLVVLVLGDYMFPGKKNFVKTLVSRHPEITSIVININKRTDSMILGDKSETVYGSGIIVDTLLGKKFSISAESFYQVNRRQAEKLYSKAYEYAVLDKESRVLDAYCGTGTIGICASDLCGSVVGVELNPQAVSDAKKNVQMNKASNVKIIKADATEYMNSNASRGKFDVVILDPPREGTTPEFIKACGRISPSRIAYVSCNPETLARDLKLFDAEGYKAVKACPVDMFSGTEHVETVVLLSKGIDISAGKLRVEISVEDMDLSAAHGNASYNKIKKHVYEKTGLQVSNLNIAQVKRKYGIIERENYNLPKSENSKQPNCTPEKEKAIVAALQYFKMIG